MEKNSIENSSDDSEKTSGFVDNPFIVFGVICLLAFIAHWPTVENLSHYLDDFNNYFHNSYFQNLDLYPITPELSFGLDIANFLSKSFPESFFPGLIIVLFTSLCGVFTFLLCREFDLAFPVLVGILVACHPFIVETIATPLFYSALISKFFLLLGLWLVFKGLNIEKVPFTVLGLIFLVGSVYFNFSTILVALIIPLMAKKYNYSIVNVHSGIAVIALGASLVLGMKHIENSDVSLLKEVDLSVAESQVSDNLIFTDHVKPQTNAAYETGSFTILLTNISFYFNKFIYGFKNSITYNDDFYFSLNSHLYIGIFLAVVFLLFLGLPSQSICIPGMCEGFYLFILLALPRIGFFQTNSLVDPGLSDSNAYFLVIGMSIFFLSFLQGFLRDGVNDLLKIGMIALSVVFVLFNVSRSFFYSKTFNDNLSVVWNALDQNPKAVSLYLTLSKLYASENKINESREVYSKTLGMDGVENNLEVLEQQILAFRQQNENDKLFDAFGYSAFRYVQEKQWEKALFKAYEIGLLNTDTSNDKLMTFLVEYYNEKGLELDPEANKDVRSYVETYEFFDNKIFLNTPLSQTNL